MHDRYAKYLLYSSICAFGVLSIILGVFLVKKQDKTPLFPYSYQSILPHIRFGFLKMKNDQYVPEKLSLIRIFREDHRWIATLSADRIRTVIVTGDVIPARSVNFLSVSRNDFLWPFAKTYTTLGNADITFINLETPLFQKCPLTNEGMIFCGSDKHVQGLIAAGVDVASLANNHIGNYGTDGINETVKTLMGGNITSVGLGNLYVRDIRGVRFGFLGFNDIGVPALPIAVADPVTIVRQIRDAKNQSDIIIVAFHWGEEYTRMPTVRQRELAHAAINAGADVVIGNHPHWIQPPELYQDKFIMYAHGNFIFDQMWSYETRVGLIGTYSFFDTSLIDVSFDPVLIENYGQPGILKGMERQKILRIIEDASVDNGISKVQ